MSNLKRPCAIQRCPGLTHGQFCEAHQREYEQQRPSAASRGYGQRWQAYRKAYLARPENQHCRCGCGQKATDVDHIQPVTGPDDPLFWDPTNHQPLAHACHSRKTRIEQNARERGDYVPQNLQRKTERGPVQADAVFVLR